MTTYKTQDLFSSGPHTFRVRGLSQRHQLVEQPGADGARVVALGRTARTIEQFGVLYSDTAADLQARLDSIEAAMDGLPGELVDDLGRTWPRMVMVDFNPARIRRAGVRYAVNYTARYIQTQQEVVTAPTLSSTTGGLLAK
jgi:hypothetical protein